jgi:hypothetical protein
MRHFFAARPVAVLSRGMSPPPDRCVLVASARPPQRRLAGQPGAVAGAIGLAAVATTAHHHLGAAASAQEKPRRCSFALGGGAQNRWTNATIAGILTLHACPARCGARRRALTAKFRSAPCLPFDQGKLLPASPRPRQPSIFRQSHVQPTHQADRITASRRPRQIYAGSDRHPQCPEETQHRQVKYLSNVIEADHGKLKQLVRPVRGFKTLKTAYATIKGFEAMCALRKDQASAFNVTCDVRGEACIFERAFGLGASALTKAVQFFNARLQVEAA